MRKSLRGPPCWRKTHGGSDSGAASVFAIALVSVLLAVGYCGIQYGALVVARHRVEGAADLGALAAAGWASSGETLACAKAITVAELMGTALVSCRTERRDALVRVRAAPPAPFSAFGQIHVKARAGPVGP